MEERMIDDEYGRGIRLKKTKDGYVDVTDELAEKQDGELTAENEGDGGEEITFEFPILDVDEDDEDLVGLTPSEARALRQKKAEAAAQRRADYERACAEGNELLAARSYRAAELKFEKALNLDEVATEASVGYWRAKTADFSNPDDLASEYVEAGIQSLEYDLGYEAAEIIKKEYRSVFEKRVEELSAEEAPLAEEVEGKQERRRTVLKVRVKKAGIIFAAVSCAFVLLAALAVIFGLKNFTTKDNSYVLLTIVFAALSLVGLVVFLVFTKKFINALRIYRKNEDLTETEEGARLVEIREYKDLYLDLLKVADETEQATEAE